MSGVGATGRRGTAAVVGVVLLLAFVLAGAAVVFQTAGSANQGIEERARTLSMTDAMSEVSLGPSSHRESNLATLSMPGWADETTVRTDGVELNLTVHGAGTACGVTVELGSLEYRTGDRVVAYEAGGVFSTGGGPTVATTPDVQFDERRGRLVVDPPKLVGSGTGDAFDAEWLRDRSVDRTGDARRAALGGACVPRESVTLRVTSPRHAAWEQYLTDEMAENGPATVAHHPDNATVVVRFSPGTLTFDSDGDGVPDASDPCPATPSADPTHTDGDGVPDACDPDDDGDGVPDRSHVRSVGGPSGLDASRWVTAAADNCQKLPNPSQADADGDGLGDACDPDADGDAAADLPRLNGTPYEDRYAPGDFLAGPDSCLGQYNPGQSDVDDDGLGDACDSDIDGDGKPNGDDDCPKESEDYDGVDDDDGCFDPETTALDCGLPGEDEVDVEGDGTFSSGDVRELRLQVSAGNASGPHDYNEDGVINDTDVRMLADAWRDDHCGSSWGVDAGTDTVDCAGSGAPTPETPDVDGDGDVDADDVWRHYTSLGGPYQAALDYNDDGNVTVVDTVILRYDMHNGVTCGNSRDDHRDFDCVDGTYEDVTDDADFGPGDVRQFLNETRSYWGDHGDQHRYASVYDFDNDSDIDLSDVAALAQRLDTYRDGGLCTVPSVEPRADGSLPASAGPAPGAGGSGTAGGDRVGAAGLGADTLGAGAVSPLVASSIGCDPGATPPYNSSLPRYPTNLDDGDACYPTPLPRWPTPERPDAYAEAVTLSVDVFHLSG